MIEAELADGRVLEFPEGTDPKVIQATVKKLLSTPSQAERGVGSELWRQGELALRAGMTGVAGVPQLLGGAMEAVAPNLLKGAGVNVGTQLANRLGLAQPESDVERVSQQAASAMAGGTPFLKAGQVLQTAAPEIAKRVGAVMAAQPAAQTALAGVSGGASEAARIGGAGPVGQTVAGLAAPLVAAPAAAVVKGAGTIAKNIVAPLVSESAAERGAARLVARGVGERGQQVAQALRSASDEQTAGQIATALENADLAALQSVANRTDQTFAEVVKQGVQDRIKRGWSALEEKLAPVRDSALAIADQGKVDPTPILNRITTIENARGNKADQVVQKSMADLRERVLSITKDGVADPFELHTIRKQISSTIEKFSKESATWDKKKSASLERELQLGIDGAIESAITRADPSKKGLWSDAYMKAYATGAKTLSNAEDAITREAQLAAKGMPAVRRSIGATESPITGLNLLNRVVTLTNAALRAAEGSAGTKVEAALARMMAPKEQGGDVQKLGRLVQSELDRPKGFMASLRGEPITSRTMLGYSAAEPTKASSSNLSLAPQGGMLSEPSSGGPLFAPKPLEGRGLLSAEQAPLIPRTPDTKLLSQRHDVPTVEFTLHQEVLNNPQIMAAFDSFAAEANRLQTAIKNSSGFWRNRNQAELAALQEEFMAGLKQLGIKDEAQARGLARRALYEGKGVGNTQRGVETTFDPRSITGPFAPRSKK